jgi:hypothetical protein
MCVLDELHQGAVRAELAQQVGYQRDFSLQQLAAALTAPDIRSGTPEHV